MFKKLLYCFIVILLLAFAVPVFASDYGLSETAGAAGLTKYGTSLPGMVGNILGTGLSLVGILFFALMLYGGVTWMLAHGNSEQEKKALGTITAAIIGILIVLGSYALTSFVFKSVAGSGSDKGSGGEKSPVSGCVAKLDGYKQMEKFCSKIITEECQNQSLEDLCDCNECDGKKCPTITDNADEFCSIFDAQKGTEESKGCEDYGAICQWK